MTIPQWVDNLALCVGYFCLMMTVIVVAAAITFEVYRLIRNICVWIKLLRTYRDNAQDEFPVPQHPNCRCELELFKPRHRVLSDWESQELLSDVMDDEDD